MPVEVNASSVERKQTEIKELSASDKFFILRRGSQSYALSNLVIDQTKMTLTANVSDVPPQHQLYMKKKKRHYTYSKTKKQDVVLKEIHLFTGDTSAISGLYTLPLADIQKIESIEFDKRRTHSSYVWGSIGVTLGSALAIAGIAAALYEPPAPQPSTTSGSCPYISAYNGGKYSLQGEIYSSAIYPALQREDYLPLKVDALDGVYFIKINNELKEIQYTDFANLMIAEHDNKVRLLIDPQGNIHSIGEPIAPLSAVLNKNIDVSEELRYQDNRSCLFKEESNGNQNREDLYVTFKNEKLKENGKLVLNLHSSSWFSYLYNEFTKGFGGYYKKWVKEQQRKPVGELEKWANEQYIPLTVSVKINEGWKEFNKLKIIGPLLNREVVIPLDLPANEQVEVKISGGFMFWELDYAAMDYSEDAVFSLKEIQPFEAMNESGVDVLPELELSDKKFLVQPNVGDSTVLKYRSSEATPGMTQTFFLHTSGYYNHPREHSGMPRIAFLKSFGAPGALSAFSKKKFFETWSSIETAKK